MMGLKFNYTLEKDGHRTYCGETSHPERRFKEHIKNGKDFDVMRVRGGPVSGPVAKEREKQCIRDHVKNHGGRPKDNKQS